MPVRSEPWPPGAPCWVDLGVPDTGAARDFYGAVLGWAFTGGDDPQYGGYGMAEVAGGQVAGLAPQQSPDDPCRWTTYFATPDADATASRVTEAGGTVVAGPFDVGPMGRMAIAVDPQGLAFGVWQPGEHPGWSVEGEPGCVVWSEAHLRDSDAGRRFYAAVFGFTYEPVPGETDYTTFSVQDAAGGPGSGGMAGIVDQPGGERPEWLTYFWARDVDSAVAAVQERGGSVLLPPEDTPYGRMSVVADPWGARFALLVPVPPA